MTNEALQEVARGPEVNADPFGARDALTPACLSILELLPRRFQFVASGRIWKVKGDAEGQPSALRPVLGHCSERLLHTFQEGVDVEDELCLPPPLHPVPKRHVPFQAGIRVAGFDQLRTLWRRVAKLVAQLLERLILRPVPLANRSEVGSGNCHIKLPLRTSSPAFRPLEGAPSN